MRPCLIDPCGELAYAQKPLCREHWRFVNDHTKNRIYWTYDDWLKNLNSATARAYHKAVALAVAELTTKVEAGRAS
jgi:hypothetical protein